MLKDLEQPHKNFPSKMIERFREHASIQSIHQELLKKNSIGLVAINEEVIGFIIGYINNNETMIHYVNGNFLVKKALLEAYIIKAKKNKLLRVITDTFSFMENNKLFKENDFILFKKEAITTNLIMLWYEKKYDFYALHEFKIDLLQMRSSIF